MSKILIIDDNVLLGEMLKEALTAQGYAVQAALDANQGYAVALEFHPDLILLDVQLPDVAGFDLLRVLKNREELKHVPIIMITGTHSQTDHKVKAFQAGADDYVLKPFEMPELMERIKAVLRRSVQARDTRTSFPAASGGESMDPRQGPSGMTDMRDPGVLREDDKKIAPPRPVRPFGALLSDVLLNPRSLSKDINYPRVAFPFLLLALGATLLGVALTAGSPIKPLMAGLWVVGAWGAAIATLVMSCSVMGLHLNWKDGARLISLAGMPLLLKLAGAVLVSLLIGLSPFYYSAGLVLFWPNAPWAAARLDLFEIWSAVLLWILIQQWPGGTKRRSWVATILVWLVALAMTGILAKILSPGTV